MSTRSVQPQGAKVAELRTRKKLTQWKLAEQAGVDPRTVWNIENGARTLPQNLEAVAGVLGVPFSDLLAEVDPPRGDGGVVPEQFQALIEDKTAGFVGRDYVFAALEAFVARESRGYFMVEGDPGMGKSAILAQYVRQTGCIAHFNVRSAGITQAHQCLDSLCTQLMARYQLPHPSLPPMALHDGAFLMRLLEEVRAKLPAGERLVLAIDALDEVDLTSHPLGANVLYLPAVLPAGVYCVVTKRARVTVPFVVQVPQERFNLLDHQTESQQDIHTYIRRATATPQLQSWLAAQDVPVDVFVPGLAMKSENNFMYLRYVLADIERGLYQDVHLERLPVGLQGYYEDHWQHMGMTATPLPRTKLTIVYVLGEVRQPVSCGLLAEFVHEEPLTVQVVLNAWLQFLHVDPCEDALGYRVYHDSFREFLARQDIVQAAGVSLPAINALIANSLWEALYGPE